MYDQSFRSSVETEEMETIKAIRGEGGVFFRGASKKSGIEGGDDPRFLARVASGRFFFDPPVSLPNRPQ